MRRHWCGWLALGAVLCGHAPARAEDQPAAGQGDIPRVSIQFDKTEIREAMAQLGKQTGIDFIVADGVRGTFSAKFIDEPLDKILRLVALTLGAEVKLVQGIFILKPPGGAAAALTVAPEQAKAAEVPVDKPAEGAGALLPGTVPRTEQKGAENAAPLVGAKGEAPAKGTVREEIPLKYRKPSEVAAALGGGTIDNDYRYHPAGEAAAQAPRAAADPYRNLPPGARVTRNGTILLPNGVTVLPSGIVIAPDGSVYQPSMQQPYIQVPYGLTPGQLQSQLYPYQTQPQQGTLSGTIKGVPFAVGQNGVAVAPPKINAGGVTVTLPPVTIGGNQANQVPPGTVVVPKAPTIYYGTNAPNVHFNTRPNNWYYGLPPGWSYVPPTSAGNIYPGFNQPLEPTKQPTVKRDQD